MALPTTHMQLVVFKAPNSLLVRYVTYGSEYAALLFLSSWKKTSDNNTHQPSLSKGKHDADILYFRFNDETRFVLG